MIDEINRREKRRYRILITFLIFVLFISITISLTYGQYRMSPQTAWAALCNYIFRTSIEISQTAEKVVYLIRLPRTVAAFIVGSSLAVSGTVFQSTFNNKLVSPDILGVSAGACVGAAIAILLGVSQYLICFFAFSFGILSVAIAITLPRLFKNNLTVAFILSGIIVGSLMNSIIGLIKFVADQDEKLAEITFWIMGKLTGVTFSSIWALFPVYLLSIIIVFHMRWKMNVLSLGEDEASSLGLNYRVHRLTALITASCLTACSVSISGNVGWVGLVVPHICRAFIGSDNRYVIPSSFLFGGAFMIAADFIARNLSIDEVPLSIVTGLVGTTIYTVILWKKGAMIHE